MRRCLDPIEHSSHWTGVYDRCLAIARVGSTSASDFSRQGPMTIVWPNPATGWSYSDLNYLAPYRLIFQGVACWRWSTLPPTAGPTGSSYLVKRATIRLFPLHARVPAHPDHPLLHPAHKLSHRRCLRSEFNQGWCHYNKK